MVHTHIHRHDSPLYPSRSRSPSEAMALPKRAYASKPFRWTGCWKENPARPKYTDTCPSSRSLSSEVRLIKRGAPAKTSRCLKRERKTAWLGKRRRFGNKETHTRKLTASTTKITLLECLYLPIIVYISRCHGMAKVGCHLPRKIYTVNIDFKPMTFSTLTLKTLPVFQTLKTLPVFQ